LGERLLCKQEVIGSIPFTSTSDGGREREGRWCAKSARVQCGCQAPVTEGGCCVAPVAFPEGDAVGVSADL
jgi:hypothetical protein